MRPQVQDVRRAAAPQSPGALSRGDEIWLRAMELGAATGCHQRPQRSFFVAGRQMPVCARCFGAGVGWLTGLPLALATGFGGAKSALLLIPMAVDGLRQNADHRHKYESTNPRRFVTGLLAGLGCAGLVVGILRKLAKRGK